MTGTEELETIHARGCSRQQYCWLLEVYYPHHVFCPCTAELWNSLPFSVFPSPFNLSTFKGKIYKNLRSSIFFFSLFLIKSFYLNNRLDLDCGILLPVTCRLP